MPIAQKIINALCSIDGVESVAENAEGKIDIALRPEVTIEHVREELRLVLSEHNISMTQIRLPTSAEKDDSFGDMLDSWTAE